MLHVEGDSKRRRGVIVLLQGGNLAALHVANILAARLHQADRMILELQEQIQDKKIHAAIKSFRNCMSHSFRSTIRPGMPDG